MDGMTPDDAFKALELALQQALLGRGVTVSNVQRVYRVGYNDAQRLMDLRDACFDQLDMLAALRGAPPPAGTCATCVGRDASGSCDLDVQDPQGSFISDASIRNWKNRDTFGCTAWTAKEGATS